MKATDMKRLSSLWLAMLGGRNAESEGTAFGVVFATADPDVLRRALDAYRAEAPEFPKIQALEVHVRAQQRMSASSGQAGWTEDERGMFARRLLSMPSYRWARVDQTTVPDWQIGIWFGAWLDHRNPDRREPTAKQAEVEAKLVSAGWERIPEAPRA
mgnify:CR=1 FL=1